MNKGEFIRAMADNAELTLKEATVAYDAFVGALTEALKRGEKVQLVGFGTFEVHQKAAREGINPQTKEKVQIPASKAPV
ncbi:MAG: HU family DNA-binding protein, partial [Clostridia bacterium]|nr:HU family DNA-binding protein [Clostridia bacterium]